MSVTYPDLTYTTFPDTEQSFVEMIDLTSSDGALMTQYQTAMQNGDFATARTVLAQIPNYNNKILDSVKMNTLFDTTIALERFYKTNVEPYIEEKQQEWEGLVALFTANFAYIGPYQQDNQYKQNNMVSAINPATGDTNIYIAIKDNSAPLSDTTSWRVLTIKGLQGLSGEGLTFAGAWNSTTAYNTNDVVTYQNELWSATQPNTNQEPSDTSEYWQNYGNFPVTTVLVSQSQPSAQSVGDFWFQVVT